MTRLLSILAVLVLAVMLLSSSMFVVDQHRYAVVYALGELHEVVREPSLHFKLPPPFQNVVYLDKRLQTLDTPDDDRFLTQEKKDLLVILRWAPRSASTTCTRSCPTSASRSARPCWRASPPMRAAWA
jgi:regulator of protease activity HflC (stomatin/prohibitin superfamily)